MTEDYVPPVRRIQNAVAAACGVGVGRIVSRRHDAKTVDARHLSIALARQLLPSMSITAIARAHLHGRHAAIAALREWPQRLRRRPWLQAIEREALARLGVGAGGAAGLDETPAVPAARDATGELLVCCPHCRQYLSVPLVQRAAR